MSGPIGPTDPTDPTDPTGPSQVRVKLPVFDLESVIDAAFGSAVPLVAFSIPAGVGAVAAAMLTLAFPPDSALISNASLVVAQASPLTALVSLTALAVAAAGVLFGAASAIVAVASRFAMRPISSRAAWRAAAEHGILILVVGVAVSAGSAAAAAGLSVTSAVNVPLFITALVVMCVIVIIVSPLFLWLPAGLLVEPRSLRALAVGWRATSGRMTAGPAREIVFLLVMGVVGATLLLRWLASVVPNAIGWDLLAGILCAALLAVLDVLAIAILTGFAIDGLGARGLSLTLPVAAPPRPRGHVGLLWVLAAVALGPLVAAALLVVNPVNHVVVASVSGDRDWSDLTVAPFGDGGAFVMSSLGPSISANQTTACATSECVEFDVDQRMAIDIAGSESGDLLFVRWRPVLDAHNVVTSASLTVTRVKPDDVAKTQAEQIAEGTDSPSYPIGYPDERGTISTIDQLPDGVWDRHDESNLDRSMRVSLDTSGETPIIATLIRLDAGGTTALDVWRCDDEFCSSAEKIGTTDLEWAWPIGQTHTSIDTAVAPDGSVLVGLLGLVDAPNPLQLISFAPDGGVTKQVLVSEPRSDKDIINDDSAGVRLAINGNGTPTLAWHLPGDSEVSLSTCDDLACTSMATVAFPYPHGAEVLPTLAIDDTGRPMLLGYDWDQSAATLTSCDDVACRKSHVRTIAKVDFPGGPLGLTLDPQGRPLIVIGVPRLQDVPLWKPDSRTQILHCATARCGAP